MQNNNIHQQFKEFAQKKLNNHLLELNTRYENMDIDKHTKQLAYQEHRQIYEKELNEKMRLLLPREGNEWLQGEMEKVIDQYLLKIP